MTNSLCRLSTLWFFLVLAGCSFVLTSLVLFVLAFALPETVLGSYASALVGIGLIVAMLGIGLLVEGLRSWRGKQSIPITTRWGWLILLLMMFVLGGCVLMLPSEFQSSPLFALFHFGLVVLPAFILLLLVIRLSGTRCIPTLRQVIVTVTGGASSVIAALPLELMGFIIISALILIGASFFPAAQEEVSRLVSIIQLWMETPPTNIESLLSIATSPVAVFCLVVVLSVLTPVVEEFVKTLVVGIMGIWMRPGLDKVFIWGLSCGLGFAIVEGITNGSIGLGDKSLWLGSIFARLLATMMHALTSGLLGLGWGSLWQRKWWRLPVFYVVAVIFHGLWNLSVVLIVVGGLMSSTQLVQGLVLAVLGGGMLLTLILMLVTGFIAVSVILKHRQIAPESADFNAEVQRG